MYETIFLHQASVVRQRVVHSWQPLAFAHVPRWDKNGYGTGYMAMALNIFEPTGDMWSDHPNRTVDTYTMRMEAEIETYPLMGSRYTGSPWRKDAPGVCNKHLGVALTKFMGPWGKNSDLIDLMSFLLLILAPNCQMPQRQVERCLLALPKTVLQHAITSTLGQPTVQCTMCITYFGDPEIPKIWIPKIWMVFVMENDTNMDDDWGYPHSRKPPVIVNGNGWNFHGWTLEDGHNIYRRRHPCYHVEHHQNKPKHIQKYCVSGSLNISNMHVWWCLLTAVSQTKLWAPVIVRTVNITQIWRYRLDTSRIQGRDLQLFGNPGLATGHASLPELRIWHPLWIEPLPPRTNAPAASSALFCGQTAAPACMLSWTSAPSASKQLQNLGQHSKILKYLKVYAVKSCTIPRLPHVSDDFHLIHVRRPED